MTAAPRPHGRGVLEFDPLTARNSFAASRIFIARNVPPHFSHRDGDYLFLALGERHRHFGFLNENHHLLFDLIKCGAIVIYECGYEFQEPCADSEAARRIRTCIQKGEMVDWRGIFDAARDKKAA